VGKARAESVTRKPYPHIPDRFEFVDNCLKRCSSVRAEEARNIFQDNPWRSNFSSQCRKGEEQPAPGTVDAFSLRIRVADVLARPPSSPKRSIWDFFGFKRSDVVMKWNLRPVPFKDALTERIDFTMERWYHSCTLESKIESPDSSEKRSKSHL
jgi:hypothetical protein